MTIISFDIQEAVHTLQAGTPVALPTETVYGLAADAQNEESIRAVFTLKNRPLDHPLIMHVAPEWDLMQWISYIPDYAKILIHEFWPGPLTLVLNCDEINVPSIVRGGQNSVAIRSPNHPKFLECLRQFGSPLVAPSANPFGKVSPTTASHVADSFPDSDLLIIDGGRCAVGIESTIIDARSDDGYKILRHGIIQEKDIKHIVEIGDIGADKQLRVSGHLKTHYQPEKPLFTFETENERDTLINRFGKNLFLIDVDRPESFHSHLFFKWPETPEIAAYELYYQMRTADKSDIQAIAIRMPPRKPSWSAIRDKLIKASQK